MAGSIKHRHQSAIAPTGADVDRDEWNDSLVAAGGTNGQFMQRDSSQTDGWKFASALTRGTFAARAAADGKQGLYLPSDGYTIGQDTGAAFATFGPNFPFTSPTDPGSWVNQGSSSISSIKDSLIFTGAATGNAENIVARVGAYPATPWTLTMYFLSVSFGKNNSVGMCFREAGTGKIVTFEWFQSVNSFASLRTSKYTSATVKSADYQTFAHMTPPRWMRIADDGVNRVSSISDDGQNWVTFHSVTRTDFFTTAPDQYGIMMNTQNSATPNLAPVMTVLHLSF